MWLATQHGFYSIVQKAENTYFVRARIRQDLVNLIELLDLDTAIIDWPQEGYRYRVMVDLDVLLELMVQFACAIDYPNFKARISPREAPSHQNGNN